MTSASLFKVATDLTAVPLDERHLPRWCDMARDVETAKWLELQQYSPETLKDINVLRDDDWVGWVRQGVGAGREIVVETKNGELVAGVYLAGGHCPEDPEGGAVEFGYAVHPDHREAGIAQKLLTALPAWVRAETGLDHTYGTVCASNGASLHVAATSKLSLVRRQTPFVGSADQRRHRCADLEHVFCSHRS